MITAQLKEVEKVTAQAKQLSLSAGVPKEETDPTVPDWAKQPNKPNYTAAEVGALPADTKIPSKPEDVGAMPADKKIPSTASEVGAIPVPSTATVGQTIRVSAVDESGKPTEWEAVDFPEGGGGDKWDVVYKTKITEALTEGFEISDVDGIPLCLEEFWFFAKLQNGASAAAWTGCNIRANGSTNQYYQLGNSLHVNSGEYVYFSSHGIILPGMRAVVDCSVGKQPSTNTSFSRHVNTHWLNNWIDSYKFDYFSSFLSAHNLGANTEIMLLGRTKCD